MSTENEVKNAKEVTKQKKEHNDLDLISKQLGEDRAKREAKEAINRKEKISSMQTELETMQQFGMIRDAEIRQQELLFERMKEIEDLQKKMAMQKQKGLDEDQLVLKLTDEIQKKVDKMNEDYKDLALTQENLNEKLFEQDEIVDKLKENTSEYDDILGGIASKIGLGNSGLLKTVKHYTDIGKKLLNNDGEMKKFVKSAKQMFSLQNLAASLIESYIGLALQIDNAGAKIAAATGAGTKFRDTLSDIKLEGYEMGRSVENISQSLLAFNDNLIGMNSMSSESIKQLGAMGADFQRLGVSGQEFTQTLNIMTKSMGVSNKHAAKLTQELAMIGTNIGLSSQRMIKDFSAASSVLAAQGSKSIKIFKNLASAARNSGVEMSELLGIASKFDTFSDAAETTAKLNAVLGSQMSATRMLMMDEDKRIEQIIRSVQASGKQFSQMDRFTQKAIANAAGISDMAKANQIFGMSLGAYRKSQTEMNKQADIQKKFSDAVKATIPIQEKFADMLQSIAANKGFMKFMNQAIDFMKGFADIVIKVNTFGDGLLGKLILLGGAFKLLVAVVPGLGSAVAFFGKMLGLASLGADKAAASSVVSSKAIAAGIVEIAGAATLGAKGLAVISLAAIAVGAGIYLAATGAAELVKAFGGLGDAAMPAAVGLAAFSFAIYGIATALAGLSATSVALGPGLAVLGVLSVIMIGISLAASTIAESLESMGESITSSITALTTGLTNASLIADVIRQGAQALEDIPNSAEFQATMHSMATIASGGRYIAETATATAGSSFSPMQNYNPSVNVNNSFGNLKLVLSDGTQLDAYISNVVDQ